MALLVLAVLAAANLAAPELASAHLRRADALVDTPAVVPAPLADVRPVSIAPATPAPRPLWPLAAGLALAGLALTVVAPRRALRLALVLLLVVFTAESAVHSVHHLADQQAAKHCVIAAASAHVHGVSLDAPAQTLWLPTPVGAVAAAAPDRPGARPLRPDEGRAPPA